MRSFEKAPPDVRELLSKPIRDLGLKLEGSSVERFVHQLYRELERKGLRKFRPLVYLSDEWGCPDEEPVIGIPFYLADPKLAKLEREATLTRSSVSLGTKETFFYLSLLLNLGRRSTHCGCTANSSGLPRKSWTQLMRLRLRRSVRSSVYRT